MVHIDGQMEVLLDSGFQEERIFRSDYGNISPRLQVRYNSSKRPVIITKHKAVKLKCNGFHSGSELTTTSTLSDWYSTVGGERRKEMPKKELHVHTPVPLEE